MNLTRDQISALYAHLAKAGFVAPYDEWLEGRLQDIHFQLERIRWQRDSAAVMEAAHNWQEAHTALNLTSRLIEHWHDDLTSERISPDIDMTAGDAWNYDKAEPITEVDLACLMVPPEFAESEIDTCRRVLAAVRERTAGTYGHHKHTYETRPVRKEKPEIWIVLGGLMRIWCQAMKIEKSDLALSMSDSNAAMNFIEDGAGMLLPEPMKRETIFKRLIEHRERARG